MEITFIYIISQIITVAYFGLLGLSYLLKNRTKILEANVGAHIGQITAMSLLGGYTGAAMAGVMLLRDVLLLTIELRKSKGKSVSAQLDRAILIGAIALILILTIFTYGGPLSLLSVAATLVLTFALWQKNTRVYKFLGIISGILWLLYNVFIFSIMGIILETVLMICSIVGYLKERPLAS